MGGLSSYRGQPISSCCCGLLECMIKFETSPALAGSNKQNQVDCVPMPRTIATVSRLFVYPVKSMAGVPVEQAHVGINGLLGDRRYAFVRADQAASNNFPWMTARQATRMLLYRPRFEQPPTPEKEDPAVQVRTPEGAERAVSDPALREELAAKFEQSLFLLNNGNGIFDCQHLSIFSLATMRALEEESGSEIDPRQFRANIYIEPAGGKAYDEDQWVGQMVRIGNQVMAAITARDPRCMMINLNPDTVVQDARVLRTVAQNHEGQIGVYANLVLGGLIKVGDAVAIA